MKKKGNWIMLLFIASLAIFGMYLCYDKIIKDSVPPVVSCDSEILKVSVKAGDDALLQGVTAVDDKSGDVTNSLVIEKMSKLAGEERIITYAAVDEMGNVGRGERTLKYTDYKPPVIAVEEDLRFPMGSRVDLLQYVNAKSVLDGDLTDKIKYSMPVGISTNSEGAYQVEFRVTDSAGTTTYLKETVEIYNSMNRYSE